MEKYIYKDKNLLSFEKYELFDPSEENWRATTFIPSFPQGVRHIDSLYIKGINRIFSSKTINCKDFFSDYLKLGKKLFELATSRNKISFTLNEDLDDSELNSNYIEKVMTFDTAVCSSKMLNSNIGSNFSEKQNCILEEVLNLRDKFSTLAEDKNFNNLIYGLIDIIDDIINLLLENTTIQIDIYKNLCDLLGIVKKAYNYCNSGKNYSDVEITKNLLLAQAELSDLQFRIEDIQKKNNFDLRKNLTISNRKKYETTTKTNVYNKFKDSLLEVVFTYNQIKDLKRIIINWLDNYGFPYYVKESDEVEYRNKIIEIFKLEKEENKNEYNGIISLKENEEIIPCNFLITNSIFCYMLYKIFDDWNAAEDNIKSIFGFENKSDFRDNRSRIQKIKDANKYYNNSVCSNILGFSTKEYIVNEENTNNKFKDKDSGCDLYFNNLLLVSNRLINEKTLEPINIKQEKCPICGKKFTKNKDRRGYCSEKCAEKGKTEGNRKKKQKNKKKQGT